MTLVDKFLEETDLVIRIPNYICHQNLLLMKTYIPLALVAFAWACCKSETSAPAPTPTQAPLSNEVYYPEDYRSWTHVKSLILEAGHPLFESFGGLHHIYANAKAMEGYRNNHRFPDGSMIVFDLLQDVRQDNAISEGERKVIGVMYKNTKAFAQTGGWGFGAFENQNGKRKELDPVTGCFNCHMAQKDKDYVFSDYRP